MDRRRFIASTIAGTAATTLGANTLLANSISETTFSATRYQNGRSPWPICLDTATIRPAAGLEKKIEIAAQAGYDAIEPWDWELAEYEKQGGNLKTLAQKIKDKNLFVPSMIGLWGCIPATEEAFQKSLPATRKRLQMAADIGCTHVQAIPNEIGEKFDTHFAASCYRRLVEMGMRDYNVIPALVFVKMFPLKTMGQAMAVIIDADHPQGKIIPDVFHMYISGGGFEGLKKIRGDAFAIFQFNDAPKGMAIEDMEDKHRVYPGDGILPLPEILRDLKATGFNGCVSLELYNETYHKGNLLEVARTGLQKTLAVMEKAGV